MGRVILKFLDNHLESFKCKSKVNAEKLANKRPKVMEWNFYEDNAIIPRPKKKKVNSELQTLRELEALMRTQGLIGDLKII